MAKVLPRLAATSRYYYSLRTTSSSVLLQKCRLFDNGPTLAFEINRAFSNDVNSSLSRFCPSMWNSVNAILRKKHNVTCDHTSLFTSFHTSAKLDHGRRFAQERRRKIAIKNKAIKDIRLAKNPPPLPYKVQLMLAAKNFGKVIKPIREKDDKMFVADNVYFIEDVAYKRWTFEECINELRLNNHPSLGYSKPDGLVVAKVEFNLKGSKTDKYLDGFSKMVPIIHPYDRGVPDRTVCAIVPTSEMEDLAIEAGAIQAGGEELIKEISKGRVDLSDIDHFVAHEDILGSLNVLAGILRDKQPRFADGTVGTDIPLIISTFTRGMIVNVKKVKPTLSQEEAPDYGFCEVTIGRLDMDLTKLESNLTVILQKLNENRPKRKNKDDSFLTRCILKVEGKEGIGDEFSIIHTEVSDERVQEQEQVLNEGRKIIKEKVHQLKNQI